MGEDLTRPFNSIESAQEFMELLEVSIIEALAEVQQDLDAALVNHEHRREEALRLAVHKIKQLNMHVHKSRRMLNDLRTIRRLLFAERPARTTTAAL
jgi:hypothetical protein